MQNINPAAELENAIQLLEVEQDLKRQLLKEQLNLTYESLRPINLLRKSLKDVILSHELMNMVIENVAGLATGYLSKKIFVGSSGNLIRKFIGVFIQTGVSKLVAQHPDTIKSFGQFILQYFLQKKERDQNKGVG